MEVKLQGKAHESLVCGVVREGTLDYSKIAVQVTLCGWKERRSHGIKDCLCGHQQVLFVLQGAEIHAVLPVTLKGNVHFLTSFPLPLLLKAHFLSQGSWMKILAGFSVWLQLPELPILCSKGDQGFSLTGYFCFSVTVNTG